MWSAERIDASVDTSMQKICSLSMGLTGMVVQSSLVASVKRTNLLVSEGKAIASFEEI